MYDNLTDGSEWANASNESAPVPGRSLPLFVDRPEAYIVPILFVIIFIVGVVGNGTLIYIVTRNKNMRNTPNVYIVSLASGDLLLLLVSVPFTATIYTLPEWRFGTAMCKLNEFLQTLSLGVSVFTLTALSADRFCAIVNPMRVHQVSLTKRTFRVAAGVWVLACVLALPDAVFTHVEGVSFAGAVMHLCIIHPGELGAYYPKLHAMFRFLVYLAVPITIIFTFYVLMARVLLQSSRHLPAEDIGTSQARKQLEARKRVAKVVLSFVVVFVSCWLPRHVYVIWYHFDSGSYNMFWHVFKICGFCLSFINSCVNPFALYLLSKQFRRYYDRYLFCCCYTATAAYKEAYSHSAIRVYTSINRRNDGTTSTVINTAS